MKKLILAIAVLALTISCVDENSYSTRHNESGDAYYKTTIEGCVYVMWKPYSGSYSLGMAKEDCDCKPLKK